MFRLPASRVLSDEFKRAAKQPFETRVSAKTLRFGERCLGGRRCAAEIDQGGEYVGLVWREGRGGHGRPGRDSALESLQLLFQFEHHALRGFLAHSRDADKARGVAGANRNHQIRCGHPAENGHRKFRADAADGDEAFKKALLVSRHKAVEHDRVFPDGGVDVHACLLFEFGKSREAGDRNRESVPHPTTLEDHFVRVLFDESSTEMRNHGSGEGAAIFRRKPHYMARKRFFVDAIRQSLVTLGGDEARHLRQVLRAEPGQKYELCDGARVVLAEIISFRKGDVTFQVLEEIPQVAPLLDLTLYAALIKLDRYEWIVEKATELGVARIVPLVTERTDFGLEKAVPGKLERWRRIALEASKQSHRMAPPRIEEAMSLGAALGEVDGLRLILDENETKPMLDALPGATERNQGESVVLVTGPEGGWTDAERTQAREAGFLSVSLGPVLLRAETAAVAGIAVMVAAWGVEGAGLTKLSSRSV